MHIYIIKIEGKATRCKRQQAKPHVMREGNITSIKKKNLELLEFAFSK